MGKSFVDSRKVTSSVNGKSMLEPSDKRLPKPKKVSSLLRAFFHLLPHPLFSCRGSDAGLDNHPQPGNCVIGTLYGQRKGHVFLAIQDDPKCFPLFILELATPTSSLVKEMASGLVRIALECEKTAGEGKLLLQESTWSMFCNGRKTGYATRRDCTEIDRHILTLVQAVSMGAGVLPMANEGFEGELMYMRARFERVIASADSESFYMMNPDGSEGPELSIFLMRA